MKKILWLFLALSVLLTPRSHAQTARTITGLVTGASDHNPIPGVNVVVKGTTNGTQTNSDGRYSLSNVAQGSTLVFSFVGYAAQERSVGTKESLDVVLIAATQQLNEAVVTAFGVKQDRRELNYAVQQVTGQAIVDTRQNNVVNALQGKIAGVNVTSSGGAPGEGAAIVIRGGTSLDADNQPLFVVDGIIMDNSSFAESRGPGGGSSFNGILGRSVANPNRSSDINPEDIETITVLKGPAAATLYGLRAANGAVVITTKHGKSGVTNIDFRTTFSVDEVSRLPKLQDRFTQGTQGNFDPATRLSWGPAFQSGDAVYDNLGNFFKRGTTAANFFNMSGGNEKASFFLSASNLNQRGVVPNSKYEKSSVRLSGTGKLSEKLTASASANYINSGGTRPLQGPGLFGSSGGYLISILNYPRNDDMRNYLNPDGSRRRLLPGFAGSGNDQDADNPYFTVYRNPQTDRTARMIGNASLSFDATKWMNLSYNIGIDFYNERKRSVRAYGTSQIANEFGGVAETSNYSETLTSNFLVNLHHRLNENFGGSLLLGNAVEQDRTDGLDVIGTVFKTPSFVGINNTVSQSVLHSGAERRIVGELARLSLDAFNQVFLELQGRYDISSTLPRPDQKKNFGKGFGYGSASLGYEFTRTLGLDQNPILNYGKLRASYATVGKDTGPYQVDSPLTQATYIGGGVRNGFFGSNRLLKPERTGSFEAGVDLQFLKNRLGLDFNYYNSLTKDQLIAPRVSQATGFILQYINGGSVRNEGIEIALTGSPVRTQNFRWDVVTNFYHNHNSTYSLPSVLTVLYQSDAFVIDVAQGGAYPGKPITGIGATDYQRAPDGQVLISPTTGLPLVNTAFSYQGNRAPQYTVQINNTLTYKELSLSFLLDFRKGGSVVNGNEWASVISGLSRRTLDRGTSVVFPGVVKTTAPDGTVSYVPNTKAAVKDQAYYTNTQNGYAGVGTNFIEDGSWARLRYVTLAYHLPTAWLSPTKFLKGAELSVTGRNLVLFTKYSGVDPETAAAGAGVRGGGSNGFDYGGVPATRGVDMALRVNF